MMTLGLPLTDLAAISMFKEAQFGDLYKTRNGLKAVYLWGKRGYNSIIVEGYTKPMHFDDDGIWYNKYEQENDLDIIGKYEKEK